MPVNQCMRMVPLMGRRLAASPWPVQPVRGLFSPWSRPTDIGALVRDMDRQMDHLERQMFRGMPSWFQRPSSILLNAIDHTKEDGNQYRVAVDLAGFKPEEIKLALDDSGRLLTISAKCERSGRDGSRFAQEMSRTITLPESIDTDSITSMLHQDGVLAIEAPFKEQPKAPREEPRSIPITRGTAGAAIEGLEHQQHDKAESNSS
ncbi:heat shock protein Hsp-16.1/Hsp-16.11-like [Thrips palmi]|uniref:Heat shock protein Hsp-16.1/Hsp-16.11-like n=1 Tax=Thrips palmi TaxID=161013 RepID=A0A6P8YI73_THRPL|nr:heat shock protein Hsp-16.1/Hsp-16.11-like [Thrips palmi]